MAKSSAERFWSKVDKSAECWTWTAYRNANGYGKFWDATSSASASDGKVYAHRWSYVHHFGDIPAGLEVDHRCGNRACVNPLHLEAVSHRVNMLRGDTIAALHANKTTCPLGHDLIEYQPHRRRCVECHEAGTPNGDKTECKRGHAFTDENTYWFPDGSGRGCRTCRRMHSQKAQERTRGAR